MAQRIVKSKNMHTIGEELHFHILPAAVELCEVMPGRTSGEELFKLLNVFKTEARLSWEKCVSVTVRMGHKSGVIARIKAVNPNVVAMRYMLHCQALASSVMKAELHSVLNTVVATMNLVK